MGNRPWRVKQADGQGQLSPHKYTGDLAQSARCYRVFIPGCLWSLSCCENQTWELGVYSFISPFGTFQYTRMPFGLAKMGSVYSRMLDMAMKEVDRDFWTSYLDNILTYSGEPWLIFNT